VGLRGHVVALRGKKINKLTVYSGGVEVLNLVLHFTSISSG